MNFMLMLYKAFHPDQVTALRQMYMWIDPKHIMKLQIRGQQNSRAR